MSFETAAEISIGRAVLFGVLAITTSMLGVAFDLVLAVRVGAVLTLVMSATLLWFASTAPKAIAERTEAWLILPESERPTNDVGKRKFRAVLQGTYIRYARFAFMASVTLFVAAALLALTGLKLSFL
ncbi:MAG: hypothetical protein HC779_06980 [Phyllobacteriaceae bacterium]|nr:hypothetical protein [Phyllobacteriaceae bacterium]